MASEGSSSAVAGGVALTGIAALVMTAAIRQRRRSAAVKGLAGPHSDPYDLIPGPPEKVYTSLEGEREIRAEMSSRSSTDASSWESESLQDIVDESFDLHEDDASKSVLSTLQHEDEVREKEELENTHKEEIDRLMAQIGSLTDQVSALQKENSIHQERLSEHKSVTGELKTSNEMLQAELGRVLRLSRKLEKEIVQKESTSLQLVETRVQQATDEMAAKLQLAEEARAKAEAELTEAQERFEMLFDQLHEKRFDSEDEAMAQIRDLESQLEEAKTQGAAREKKLSEEVQKFKKLLVLALKREGALTKATEKAAVEEEKSRVEAATVLGAVACFMMW